MKAILIFNMSAFLFFGLWALFDPNLLSAVQVQLTGPAGAVEIRAMYGGLEIGLAAYFLIALLKSSMQRSACILAALTIGGIGICRAIFTSLHASDVGLLWFLSALEITTMFINLFFALKRPVSST